MAQYQVLPTDPAARKVWSAQVAIDGKKKSRWAAMTGSEADAMPAVIKTDLESGPGDEVTTTLIAKLRGKPIEGSEKGEGREKKLSHYTQKLRIDKHRQLVNVGDVMTQKRVGFNIGDQVKARLSDYVAEVTDEQCHMTASGTRGVGDEIQHYPLGYLGFPNAFSAPDAAHLQIGDGLTAATLTGAGAKLGTAVIDRALVRAKKMLGIETAKGARMEPVMVNSDNGAPGMAAGKHFVMLTSAESMYDLRREVGEAGWLTLEKAKAAAVGAQSPLFQGGDAYYNGVLVAEHETCVKISGYTTDGATAAPAVRNLFLGAHAISCAYGTKGQKGGVRYQLDESDLDHGEEEVVIIRLIAGWQKNQFNSLDFGVQAVDTAFTAIN
jgi:N4-gp56 family major capsid protein